MLSYKFCYLYSRRRVDRKKLFIVALLKSAKQILTFSIVTIFLEYPLQNIIYNDRVNK